MQLLKFWNFSIYLFQRNLHFLIELSFLFGLLRNNMLQGKFLFSQSNIIKIYEVQSCLKLVSGNIHVYNFPNSVLHKLMQVLE